jgi:hypothetical protein
MPGSSTEDGPREGEVALGFDPGGAGGRDAVLHRAYPVALGQGDGAEEPAQPRGRPGKGRGSCCQAGLRCRADGPVRRAGDPGALLGRPGQRDLIVQTPRHTDGPRGVFALRSPVRPNPIALGTVVITSIDGNTIGIDATDAWDGTPVLDIKPWIPTVDVPPGWRPEG